MRTLRRRPYSLFPTELLASCAICGLLSMATIQTPMTIKINEFWTDETFYDIARKIKANMREVKFGIFNSFPKSFEMFPLRRKGEYEM